MDESQKKVDENWKQNVEKEKAESKDKPQGDGLPSDRQSHRSEDRGLPSDRQSHRSEDRGLPSDRQSQKGEFVPPVADFKFFITTLTLQASIALGQMANPTTQKIEKDPAQAQFLIDTLDMLRDKTKGNLAKEEAELLENLLYELRVAYLAK